MLQKEEKIIVVLLIISLIALSIAYLFLPGQSAAEYSNSSRAGEKVFARGTVSAKQPTRTGGNLILELKLNSTEIKIFIPKSANATDVARKVKIGDLVQVYGIVEEYKGSREVVVRDASDVFIEKAI